MNKQTIIIAFLFITSGFLYYNLLVNPEITKSVFVARVIDGDTFEDNNGQRYRLKGINTPETNEPFYEEAKEFVIQNIENKSIEINSYGIDKYQRILAYSKINKDLLEEGLAYLYYYGTDSNYNELKKAEEGARISEVGLWKKSPNANCIELINLKFKESPKRCTNNEQLVLKNSCNIDLNIIIKDDATHIYKEKILQNSIFIKNFSCIWNNAGDTLYVRDELGLLIFYRYK
ncbi:MAG: thermonuclease family protein [Nanoarchaeota archaeon]|nr:thermonuclease family protein [Nanoarchaeota archaeon]